MIVLDTNVISEAIKVEGNPAVLAWLDRQVANTLFLTSVTLAELLVGVEILPPGRRRDSLAAALDGAVSLFGSNILPFDRPAAVAYAPLIARARANGGAISLADGQIAAIAVVRGFAVATRDTAPFVAGGVPVIDPWQG